MYLDILQCEVLGLRSAVDFEAGCFSGDEIEERLDGGDESVHVHVDMITSNCIREVFGTLSSVIAGVLRSHESGME